MDYVDEAAGFRTCVLFVAGAEGERLLVSAADASLVDIVRSVLYHGSNRTASIEFPSRTVLSVKGRYMRARRDTIYARRQIV